jgi:hypothetical protein
MMITVRVLFAMILLSSAALAQQPVPVPAPQQQIDPVTMAYQLGISLGTALTQMEAQKATLIEWLKAAQAETEAVKRRAENIKK